MEQTTFYKHWMIVFLGHGTNSTYGFELQRPQKFWLENMYSPLALDSERTEMTLD